MKKNFSLAYKTIGLNICILSKTAGPDALQLADRINISRTHMSNIEAPNMPTSLSLEVLLSIAEELDIPAYKLLQFPADAD